LLTKCLFDRLSEQGIARACRSLEAIVPLLRQDAGAGANGQKEASHRESAMPELHAALEQQQRRNFAGVRPVCVRICPGRAFRRPPHLPDVLSSHVENCWRDEPDYAAVAHVSTSSLPTNEKQHLRINLRHA
jgi:hypothetical protein